MNWMKPVKITGFGHWLAVPLFIWMTAIPQGHHVTTPIGITD
jgi:hypothetical protein